METGTQKGYVAYYLRTYMLSQSLEAEDRAASKGENIL